MMRDSKAQSKWPDGRKVFVVGFHKCGTSSLHHFFRACGLSSLHFRVTEKATPCGVAIHDNMVAGRRVIAGFEHYDAFSNVDYFCAHEQFEMGRHFRLLLKQEPDALFILNVRDIDKWVKSRMGWSSEFDRRERPNAPCTRSIECASRAGFAVNYRDYYGLPDLPAVEVHLRSQWHAHVAAVKNGIPADRLLVFDIADDDPVLLCDFLGLPREWARRYQWRNVSTPPVFKSRVRWVPLWMKKLIPRRFKDYAKVRMRAMGAR